MATANSIRSTDTCPSSDHYSSLRTDLERIASGLAALTNVIKNDDPGVAEDLARILESYACESLQSHPRLELEEATA